MAARPTTIESGLLSSWATPASSEPRALILSAWCSASRWRAISSSARFISVMSAKITSASR